MRQAKVIFTSAVLLLCSCGSGSKKPIVMHPPLQNPNGIDFESDPEFVQAYQRHLITKLRHQQTLNTVQNVTSQSAIRMYDVKDTKNLKQFEPENTGWDVEYIPPPRSKATAVFAYMKAKTANLFSGIKKNSSSGKNNLFNNQKNKKSTKANTIQNSGNKQNISNKHGTKHAVSTTLQSPKKKPSSGVKLKKSAKKQ
jgi:hypothetical protein